VIFCSADASSDSCAAINDEGLAGKIGILHREDVGLRDILRSPDPTHWQVFAKYGAELLLALWTREIGERLPVSTMPGTTTFTRRGTSSSASVHPRASTPAFTAESAAQPDAEHARGEHQRAPFCQARRGILGDEVLAAKLRGEQSVEHGHIRLRDRRGRSIERRAGDSGGSAGYD
jgi:hypothetical protein